MTHLVEIHPICVKHNFGHPIFIHNILICKSFGKMKVPDPYTYKKYYIPPVETQMARLYNNCTINIFSNAVVMLEKMMSHCLCRIYW